VSGIVDGTAYRLGRSTFAICSDDARDGLILADDHGVVAEFTVRERPRDGAASALAALRESGASTEILSGDTSARVAGVAAELAVDAWKANATPADKLAHIECLRATGHVVAMIGDGVNDAPVLAAADVSIALSSGAALAQDASGLVLAAERFEELPRARAVAIRMRQVLAQNLNWALAYNIGAVPLAALGFVPPWLAAIAMSASSLVVVLNSLRIDVPRARHTTRDDTTRLAEAIA